MRSGVRKMTSYATGIRLMATMIICLSLVALSAFSSGCGGASTSPEAAVRRYLDAWAARDWNAYKASVFVNGVPPSGENENIARQSFDKTEVQFKNPVMNTVPNNSDPTKAIVYLTGGTISSTTDILGERKTSSVNVEQIAFSERPRFQTTKLRSNWFVEVAAENAP